MPIILVLLRRFAQQLRKDHLDMVLLVLVVISITGMVGISFFEPQLSMLDAVWWTLVTITTVGYGDIYPTSLGGRVVGIFLMLFGIGFLGMLTATLASTFVENRRQEGKGMKPLSSTDHIVLCGWNYKAKEIIEEVRADEKARNRSIVLIADLPENPLDGEQVQFVSGVVSPETLARANAQEAEVAIVLADEQGEVHTRDAKTILDTLTIKTTCPSLYTCVELLNQQNIAHGKRAKADEVIVTGALSTNLLVQAALNRGVPLLINELVSNRFGSALYTIPAPPTCVGHSFMDALVELKREQNLLLVAVESQAQARFLANPPVDYIIQAEDQLIVIGQERPNQG